MKPNDLIGKIHIRDSNILSKAFIPKSIYACVWLVIYENHELESIWITYLFLSHKSTIND